jgi:hypothetical protein
VRARVCGVADDSSSRVWVVRGIYGGNGVGVGAAMRRSRRAVGGGFGGASIRRVTTDVTTTAKRTCGKAAPVRACDTASAASRCTAIIILLK